MDARCLDLRNRVDAYLGLQPDDQKAQAVVVVPEIEVLDEAISDLSVDYNQADVSRDLNIVQAITVCIERGCTTLLSIFIQYGLLPHIPASVSFAPGVWLRKPLSDFDEELLVNYFKAALEAKQLESAKLLIESDSIRIDRSIDIAMQARYQKYHEMLDEEKRINAAIIECLLEKKYGRDLTPFLMLAADHQDTDMIELLLEHGASIEHALWSARQKPASAQAPSSLPEQPRGLDEDNVSEEKEDRYTCLVKTFLDYAVGVDFADDSFLLPGMDVSGVNFMGVSIKGIPITQMWLKHKGLRNAEKALITLDDLERAGDPRMVLARRYAECVVERGLLKQTVQTKIKDPVTQKTVVVEEKEIVNLVPLWRAAAIGDIGAVKARLAAQEGDVDVNEPGYLYYDAHQSKTSRYLHYPIEEAAISGHFEVVRLLANHPKIDHERMCVAARCAMLAKNWDIADFLFSQPGKDIRNIACEDRNTPLTYAIEQADVESVRFLIKHNVGLQRGLYPSLELAIRALLDVQEDQERQAQKDQNILAIIKILLENGAYLNFDKRQYHDYEDSPLFQIIRSRKVYECLELFIKHGLIGIHAEVGKPKDTIHVDDVLLAVVHDFGKNPDADYPKIFDLLGQNGADFRKVDGKRETFLEHIVRIFCELPQAVATQGAQKYADIFQSLVRNGVDVDAKLERYGQYYSQNYSQNAFQCVECSALPLAVKEKILPSLTCTPRTEDQYKQSLCEHRANLENRRTMLKTLQAHDINSDNLITMLQSIFNENTVLFWNDQVSIPGKIKNYVLGETRTLEVHGCFARSATYSLPRGVSHIYSFLEQYQRGEHVRENQKALFKDIAMTAQKRLHAKSYGSTEATRFLYATLTSLLVDQYGDVNITRNNLEVVMNELRGWQATYMPSPPANQQPKPK